MSVVDFYAWPVRTLVGLSLPLEHRHGQDASHDVLNKGLDRGRTASWRPRRAAATAPHGRLVLAVDVSARLRPDANGTPSRRAC
ncbi:hypothetical protein OHA21_16400 [Actinoplanes sp. NBC_00393]|uniref:hypothetical protein n=1 Tax=Actinoplanes sp. NBC_00393 TaxID=2975953 RepID=UPI002E22E213